MIWYVLFFFSVGFVGGVVVRSVLGWNIEGADDYEDSDDNCHLVLCDVDD